VFVVNKMKDIKGDKYTNYCDFLKSDNNGINFICKLRDLPQLKMLMLGWFFLSDVLENAAPFMINIWGSYGITDAQYLPILLLT